MSRGRQIGRLKLQPLAPEIKEKYLLDWEGVDLHGRLNSFPSITSQALFGSQDPLEVEIGSGSGEYLGYLASGSPQRNFLGIEVSRRAAQAAVSHLAATDLDNVRVLRADFKLLLPLLVPESWASAYLHFPDPAHRHRDAKHTIFDAHFLDAMAGVLVPGGALSVVSDNAAYFDHMLIVAEADKRFAKAHSQPYQDFEPTVKSRFQRAWERKGLKARQFILHRL